jgi:hypothetical protein
MYLRVFFASCAFILLFDLRDLQSTGQSDGGKWNEERARQKEAKLTLSRDSSHPSREMV